MSSLDPKIGPKVGAESDLATGCESASRGTDFKGYKWHFRGPEGSQWIAENVIYTFADLPRSW